ncbi:MAG: TonB-dependent receptor [Chitinophagaceae bacterium]|nr:TonB-dependent receptor [Chitinophagaceae bacterium]
MTGRVTNANKEPLEGVSVTVKGTQAGTTTNADGQFQISVPSTSNVELVFSFVGYEPKTIKAAGQTKFEVVLEPSVTGLEDIVVVGYGTQKKEVVTGAITTIKAKDIGLSPSGNMAAGLAGRLSGVIINTRSGEPGSENTTIRVRGQSSFVGPNDPLIVIDGIPRDEDGGILTRLDPQDIESMTVLKDASAAIYGARAANGVILVTTKRGIAGKKPTIGLSYNHAFSQPTRLERMADSYSYARAQNLANEIRGLTAPWTDEELQKFKDGSDPVHYPNTSWFKAVQKTWTQQDKANVQLSGGSDKIAYLVSGGLLKQGTPYNNGAMKNDMYNIRSNIDAKINDYIKVTFDLFGKKTNRISSPLSSLGVFSWVGLSAPTVHAVWPGTDYPTNRGWGNLSVLASVTGEAGAVTTTAWSQNGQSTVDIKIPWVEGLSVKGSFAYDYFGQLTKNFQDVYYVYDYDEPNNTYKKIKGHVGAPQLYTEEKRTEFITGNARLNYLRTFREVHTVDAFVGFEQNQTNGTFMTGFRSNFPTGALQELNAGDANTQTNTGGSVKTARQNYFGRALYSYANKYMLQFQFRYDGSQNFPKGNRFGFFPGISGGWTLSQENFMSSVHWLNNFKLRGSWGKMGNDAVAAFQYLTMYGLTSGAVFNGTQYQGIAQSTVPNPNITWETAETADIGIDAAFLNNRLTLEFDWFKTNRSGILARRQASIPSFTGLTLPSENIGKTVNKGVELMLGFRDKPSKNFSYNVSGNATFVRNKIVYMDETPMAEAYQKQEGKPIGAALRYEAIGIYSEADIADTKVAKRPGTIAGDIKILDANGDGVINSLDRVRQRLTNIPEITYGLNIYLSWKQFDVMLGCQGQGRVVFYLRDDWVNPATSNGGGNILQWWTDDTYSTDNPNGTKPRLGTSNGIGGTTFTQVNAAFFKLKNAEIGYNLSDRAVRKVGLERARIYLSGTNLFSFDKTRVFGIDPEVANGGWDLNPLRLINIGANVSF